VLRFYCNQQESNRNSKLKPTQAIFKKFRFGLDIQMNLWYVVVLEFTNISIEELSEKCGFSSQSYFTRTFKKKIGLSPTQYRKQALEKRIKKFQT
jgi:AraC-like DNA-binding protein